MKYSEAQVEDEERIAQPISPRAALRYSMANTQVACFSR
jgi:hypothetical protein